MKNLTMSGNTKNYLNYFKDHLGARFSNKDIENQRKWLYPQWKLICKKAALNNKKNILEIGSGLGGFYSYFGVNKNYTGLELDETAARFTKKYFNKDVFLNLSFEEFETTQRYDIVFAFEVLEHLLSPISSIEKISKLLKKGGLFIGTSPYPYKKNILADKTHRYVLHPENWRKIFLENGFNKVYLYPMTFIPYIWRFSKFVNIRIPFYLPFDHIVSTCLILAES